MFPNLPTDLQADDFTERVMRRWQPETCEHRIVIHRNNPTSFSWVCAALDNNPDNILEPTGDDYEH